MDFCYIFAIFFSLLALVCTQTYKPEEADDPTVKKDRIVVIDSSMQPDITFTCTYDIPEVSNKFVNGDILISWVKQQNESLQLNNAAILSQDLPEKMKQHLDYSQTLGDNGKLVTAVTIKAARPEESGKYSCILKWRDGSTNEWSTSMVTYFLSVIDSSKYDVILHGEDNPHMVPRQPNVTSWMAESQIQLQEKMNEVGRPEEYAYLACAAVGMSMNAVISVSLEGENYPTRNLNGEMMNLLMSQYVGPEIGAQRLEITNLLEDRMFPVNGSDDGATVRCVAVIEDEDNNEILRKETSAVLNLLTKPQFVNCSSQVYSPMGARNFVIACKIRAKPPLTDVMWSVKPPNGVEFQVQDDNYGYNSQLIAEGTNMYIAKLTISEVTEQQHFRTIFTLTATNSIGFDKFRVLLLEGTNPDSQQTSGDDVHFASLLVLILSAMAALLVQ